MSAPASPSFAPGGWVQWPEHQDLSRELARLLGSCQQGAATVSECVQAASRLDPDKPETWSAEWWRLAETSAARAAGAQRNGHRVTSRGNWLRAMNYFKAAALPLDEGSERRAALLARMAHCGREFVAQLDTAGEVVQIPWLVDYALQGYLLRPAPRGAAPVLLCVAEPGEHKEDFLWKIAGDALARGLSVLAVDLLGADMGARLDTIIGMAELDTAVSACIDFVQSRDDLDSRRIAVVGDGCHSSYLARGIAQDGRVAAAVCDGGLWELMEAAYMIRRRAVARPDMELELAGDGLISRLGCPVLVPLGESSWLNPEFVRPIVERVRGAGRDISLRIFTAEETASSHGQADNPTLANEVILDWLGSRLGGSKPSTAADPVTSAKRRVAEPFPGGL